MTISFILFAAANMRGHLRAAVRHPMLLGLGIWATVHLLANGDCAARAVRRDSSRSRRSISFPQSSAAPSKTFVPEGKFDAMAVVGGTAVASS
jgi:hypothetical protein